MKIKNYILNLFSQNNFPLFFIIAYFIVGLFINLFIGNSSKTIFPILGLFLIIFLLYKSTNLHTVTLQNSEKLFRILALFIFCNAIIFFTGKVIYDDNFFKLIHDRFHLNIKYICLLIPIVGLLLLVLRKNLNIIINICLITCFSLCFLAIIIYPNPHIDLYEILTTSVEQLKINKNPYNVVYQDIYNGEFDYAYHKQIIKLVYWPLNIYLLYPFKVLFGDIRWGYIFYLLLGCFILFFGLNKRKDILLWSLALVFCQGFTFFIIKYAWIDTLVFPLLSMFFVCVYHKKIALSSVILGLIMGLKLYFIILLPLFYLFLIHDKKNIKHYFIPMKYCFIAIITFVASLLPYLITDFKSILYTIQYFNNSSPRYESLSLPGYIYYHYKFDCSGYFNILYILILITFLIKFYLKNNKNTFAFIQYAALLLAILFVLSKQAFGNYYYNILLLAIIYICFFINTIHDDKKALDK